MNEAKQKKNEKIKSKFSDFVFIRQHGKKPGLYDKSNFGPCKVIKILSQKSHLVQFGKRKFKRIEVDLKL